MRSKQSGRSLVEYTLIIALIALVCVSFLGPVGQRLVCKFARLYGGFVDPSRDDWHATKDGFAALGILQSSEQIDACFN